MNIVEHKSLKELTTFGIGGNARYYTACEDESEILDALQFCHDSQFPYTILSGGSNVLIADSGYTGCIIHVQTKGSVRMGKTLTIDAGVVLLDSIQRSHEYALGGWEKLAGIPGSIGGAIRGNVGAFGGEIKEFCTSVRALHSQTLDERVFTNEECEFSYRSSYFKENPEWVILSATFALQNLDTEAGIKSAQETIAERERRHLQNIPCAGSYFMNPVAPQWVQDEFRRERNAEPREGRVPAGWLIEKVGMKGFTVGGASSSSMHANYLINNGTATAEDVRAVARAIQDKVQNTYLTYLHEEPSLIGF